MEKVKTETFYLSWFDAKDGSRKPAGVAFFDDEFGDYRFKLDFFPDNQYYLRCLGGDNVTTRYRLEVVHKNKDGKFLRRVPVGEGYANVLGEVHIRPFPFDRELVLTLKETESEKVAKQA
jgi:hypothetical protein